MCGCVCGGGGDLTIQMKVYFVPTGLYKCHTWMHLAFMYFDLYIGLT